MRKKVFGRKLKRDTNERKALFKGLMQSLVLHESIQTTEAKAKAVRGYAEKFVTKARIGGTQAERLLKPYFAPQVMKKLIGDIAPRFAGRPGGYTRIIKLGGRFSDNAPMVMLEWVVKGTKESGVKNQELSKETNGSEIMEATAKVTSQKGSKGEKKTKAKKKIEEKKTKTEKKTTKKK